MLEHLVLLQRMPRAPCKKSVCVCVCVCARVLSRVQLFVTPCTIAAMGFPRQEYWSELLFPTPYICTYCDNTYHCIWCNNMCSLLLLPLSCSSCVQLCETPQTAAHQALPSLGFSRQEHWSGLLFPSPMHESAKWKWSRSVMSDSSWPRGLQPTRLLRPWDFPGKSTGVGSHCLLWCAHYCEWVKMDTRRDGRRERGREREGGRKKEEREEFMNISGPRSFLSLSFMPQFHKQDLAILTIACWSSWSTLNKLMPELHPQKLWFSSRGWGLGLEHP